MKHVSLKSIENAISLVDNLDDQGLEKLSEKYALAQQVLLSYVMTAPDEYENENLEGLLIYYFCLLSECFEQEGIKVNPITEEQIEKQQFSTFKEFCRCIEFQRIPNLVPRQPRF